MLEAQGALAPVLAHFGWRLVLDRLVPFARWCPQRDNSFDTHFFLTALGSGQVDRLVEEVVKRFGRLDILVNDAAYNKSIPFTDLDGLTYEEWTKIIDINLTGPMLLTKAVGPVMKRQGEGRIVNIASVAGLGPTGSSIAYAVSKAGLIHLTKCMAVALAPEVLVNCVAPGLLEGTRATANLRPEVVAKNASASLLGKPADKDDCADQVVTMCRTNSTTGQTLVIDSGRVFH